MLAFPECIDTLLSSCLLSLVPQGTPGAESLHDLSDAETVADAKSVFFFLLPLTVCICPLQKY